MKHIKPNTLVRQMLAKYGEPYLKRVWQEQGGCTKAAEVIGKDMGIWGYLLETRFDYLAKLFNWKRRIRPDHPVALGVKYGTTLSSDYPRIIFPGDEGYEEE